MRRASASAGGRRPMSGEGGSVMTRRTPSVYRRTWLAGVAATVVVGGLVLAAQPPPAADAQKAVDAAFNQFKTLKEGKNADYIPALAKVDPNLFGIALVTVDGKA